MNIFIPSNSKSLYKKKKKDRKFLLMKKFFGQMKMRWQNTLKNPFNIKHLAHLNKKNSKFQEYFKSVNISIEQANNLYIQRVKQHYKSGNRFSYQKLNIEDPTILIDTFNIIMKQKLQCDTSKDFYVKKKQKKSKIKISGEIEKCLYFYLTDKVNHYLF